MARPSVAAERTRQIVDATIRVIGSYGITGATMDRIAAEAGMSRGHVRHFVGNRDSLLREAAKRFYFDGTNETSILPSGTDSVLDAVDYLFGPAMTEPSADNVVVFGFIEASRQDPAIAEVLADAYRGTHAALADLIARENPRATRAVCESIAYGVVAVALHNVFLSDIESSASDTEAARAVADRLLASLSIDT